MQALARLGINVDDSVSLDILLGENFNGKLYGMTRVQMEKVRALREVLVTYNSLGAGDGETVVTDSRRTWGGLAVIPEEDEFERI